MERTGGVFTEQVIRPTGLIDPPVEVRPVSQGRLQPGRRRHRPRCREVARAGYRSLVTVLTKKMAEDLTEYMHEQGLRVRYMHSDVDTMERIEIIRDLRLGAFDVLVGINLLREGLDIPECGLVAILDADKEGFLRSETSPDPDHRPRRPQRRRPGHPLRRPHHRLDGARHGRDQAPPREAGGLQRRARHHARERQVPTSRTSSPAPTRTRPRHRRRVGVAEDGQALPRRQLQGHPAATWKPACARPPPTWSSRTAARLRDEIKRLKLLDLEFANEVLTGGGRDGRQGGAEAGRGPRRGRRRRRRSGRGGCRGAGRSR